jgi:hypothetical protein
VYDPFREVLSKEVISAEQACSKLIDNPHVFRILTVL